MSILRYYCTHKQFRAFDGTVPPHFYGEMSKTELGCQVLQEKGHFVDFAHFIRQHGLESDDPELTLKLKSILWAVVRSMHSIAPSYMNIHPWRVGQHRCDGWRTSLPRRRGSHTRHLRYRRAISHPFRPGVSPKRSALRLPLTIYPRTCFFVLGLISSTSQGAEILDDYHWEATLSPLGTPTGLCIPVDVKKFVSVRGWSQFI